MYHCYTRLCKFIVLISIDVVIVVIVVAIIVFIVIIGLSVSMYGRAASVCSFVLISYINSVCIFFSVPLFFLPRMDVDMMNIDTGCSVFGVKCCRYTNQKDGNNIQTVHCAKDATV